MLERFDTLQRPFSQSLDAAIVQIFHVTNNLMSRRRALSEETKPDTLHVTAKKKPSSYFTGHWFVKTVIMLTRAYQLNNCDAARRNVQSYTIGRSSLFLE